jgi:hypothetical protein
MNGRPTVLGEGRQYAATRALFEREQACVSTFAKALITPVSDDRFWRIVLKKSFSGGRTKNLRTADAVRARRREGPHRFIRKRPPAFVSAPENLADAAVSNNRLSRDFQGRSIFDFCNSIGRQSGHWPTCRRQLETAASVATSGRPPVAAICC